MLRTAKNSGEQSKGSLPLFLLANQQLSSLAAPMLGWIFQMISYSVSRGGSRYGAGRPAYKMKTESCLRLDLRHLGRQGVLRGSFTSWAWTRDGEQTASIGIRPQGKYSLRLEYACDGVPSEQAVRLEYTPCHMGGERVWFGCPVCHRRCAVLFMRAKRFACHKCQRLTYSSQCEDACGRSWRAQQKCERNWGRTGSGRKECTRAPANGSSNAYGSARRHERRR
jgi:hypothetical protein